MDLKMFRTDHLSSSEKFEVTKLIYVSRDIFYDENDKLTFTSKIKHNIKTIDEIGAHARTYRCPNCYKDEVKAQISTMLNICII